MRHSEKRRKAVLNAAGHRALRVVAEVTNGERLLNRVKLFWE